MMKDGDASVEPNQGWTSNGDAIVTPHAPFPEMGTKTLPLENRAVEDMTILRSEYPQGLVIIPTGNSPTTSPAVLPIMSSSGDNILIDGDAFVEWPDGIVVWFLG